MTTLLMILAAIAIGLGMGLMNPESTKPKKPWKPKKKNWFVRMGEGHHGPMGPVGGWS